MNNPFSSAHSGRRQNQARPYNLPPQQYSCPPQVVYPTQITHRQYAPQGVPSSAVRATRQVHLRRNGPMMTNPRYRPAAPVHPYHSNPQFYQQPTYQYQGAYPVYRPMPVQIPPPYFVDELGNYVTAPVQHEEVGFFYGEEYDDQAEEEKAQAEMPATLLAMARVASSGPLRAHPPAPIRRGATMPANSPSRSPLQVLHQEVPHNQLHQASGSPNRSRPSRFTRLEGQRRFLEDAGPRTPVEESKSHLSSGASRRGPGAQPPSEARLRPQRIGSATSDLSNQQTCIKVSAEREIEHQRESPSVSMLSSKGLSRFRMYLDEKESVLSANEPFLMSRFDHKASSSQERTELAKTSERPEQPLPKPLEMPRVKPLGQQDRNIQKLNASIAKEEQRKDLPCLAQEPQVKPTGSPPEKPAVSTRKRIILKNFTCKSSFPLPSSAEKNSSDLILPSSRQQKEGDSKQNEEAKAIQAENGKNEASASKSSPKKKAASSKDEAAKLEQLHEQQKARDESAAHALKATGYTPQEFKQYSFASSSTVLRVGEKKGKAKKEAATEVETKEAQGEAPQPHDEEESKELPSDDEAEDTEGLPSGKALATTSAAGTTTTNQSSSNFSFSRLQGKLFLTGNEQKLETLVETSQSTQLVPEEFLTEQEPSTIKEEPSSSAHSSQKRNSNKQALSYQAKHARNPSPSEVSEIEKIPRGYFSQLKTKKNQNPGKGKQLQAIQEVEEDSTMPSTSCQNLVRTPPTNRKREQRPTVKPIREMTCFQLKNGMRTQQVQFPVYKQSDVFQPPKTSLSSTDRKSVSDVLKIKQEQFEAMRMLNEKICEQQQDDDLETDSEVLAMGINACYQDLVDLDSAIKKKNFRRESNVADHWSRQGFWFSASGRKNACNLNFNKIF